MSLIICGENQAKKLARSMSVSHVLSINDMGHKHPFAYDVVAELPFRLNVKLFDDTENPYGVYSPTVMHCQEILDWFEQIDTNEELTLIHCAAGVSRSTACGLAFIFAKNLALNPAFMLRSIRPSASPNLWLSYCFDRLLKLDGKLMEAAKELRKIRCAEIGFVVDRTPDLARFESAFDHQISSLEVYERIHGK